MKCLTLSLKLIITVNYVVGYLREAEVHREQLNL